jgi:hypothetical protein
MSQKKRKHPRYIKQERGRGVKTVTRIITLTAAVLSCWLTVQLLAPVVMSSGLGGSGSTQGNANAAVMDRYDSYVNNVLADALEGLGDGVVNVIVFLIGNSPYLLVFGILLFVVVKAAKKPTKIRIFQKKKKEEQK